MSSYTAAANKTAILLLNFEYKNVVNFNNEYQESPIKRGNVIFCLSKRTVATLKLQDPLDGVGQQLLINIIMIFPVLKL
jgi:hypothetical protein